MTLVEDQTGNLHLWACPAEVVEDGEGFFPAVHEALVQALPDVRVTRCCKFVNQRTLLPGDHATCIECLAADSREMHGTFTVDTYGAWVEVEPIGRVRIDVDWQRLS